MKKIKKPLCIIPARGGSKRLPGKNIAQVAGKPLLAYAIKSSLDSGIFDCVCVSSDDNEILRVARESGADSALKRPAELSDDKAQVKNVCAFLIEQFIQKGRVYTEFAVVIPNNPLRSAQDIRDAYELFKIENANYLMSLVPFSHPPQRAVWAPKKYIRPYFDVKYMKQAQSLDKLYRHDGTIIIAKTKAFLREKDFYGSKVIPYFTPKERSLDIDTQLDLDWAEFIFSKQKN